MFRMSLTPLFNQRANYRAKVVSINEVAPVHYQIQLNVPALAKAAMPGQFVHICPVPNSEADSFDPLLRRAFSIMRVRNPERDAIDVLFRVEGRGTQALARACNGDEIDLIGPLGQPFDMSPFKIPDANSPAERTSKVFHVKQFPTSAIVVGGGVGVPPLVYLSEIFKTKGIDVYAIIGARTSSDVIGWHELSAICRDVSVTTDDGSLGHHGRVTDKLVALLDGRNNENKRGISPVVYACGPLPMLRAVAQLCAEHQVRCQVSLEENMPCGIGVCNGCVVRTRQPFAQSEVTNASGRTANQVVGNEWSPYRSYRRVCVEGPACWADEIDWEHQG